MTDTDYVFMHVINYEPTYLALREIADRWAADQSNPRAGYRDEVRDMVESDYRGAGLSSADLTDDVDYGEILDREAFDA